MTAKDAYEVSMLAIKAGVPEEMCGRPKDICPNGHWLDPDIYNTSIGDLCEQCVIKYWNTHTELDESFWSVEESANEHNYDWHPEWRIQTDPVCWTNYTSLIRAISALKWELNFWPDYTDSGELVEGGAWNVEISDKEALLGNASATELMEALFLAFHMALKTSQKHDACDEF